MLPKQPFDPITRSIRQVETDARLAISKAELAATALQRKRGTTVEANREIFDELGSCLQSANQLYDSVVAHSHLVADNIANRSQRNVLRVRGELLASANRMLELCTMATLPQGIYDPIGAFDSITDGMRRKGLLTEEPEMNTVFLSKTLLVYLATYKPAGYQFTIMVTVSTNSFTEVGTGTDSIRVSVWEDRLPPVWDTSFHDAAGEIIPIGFRKGANLGHMTVQTDKALLAYVANVLGRTLEIPTDNKPAVPKTLAVDTSRFGVAIGRPAKKGSEQFDYESHATILTNAVESISKGSKGELFLNLSPRVVTKATLARYILSIIRQHSAKEFNGEISMHPDGYYRIGFASAEHMGDAIFKSLEGKWGAG